MAHSVAPGCSQVVRSGAAAHPPATHGTVFGESTVYRLTYSALLITVAVVSSSPPPSAEPVDPPIPVPDVPGADATARGLPRRVDLTRRQRLIVDSSAIADLGLRTALASVVGAAMVPQEWRCPR